MRTTTKFLLLTLSASVACIPIEEGKETGETGTTTTPPVSDPISMSVAWGDSSVSLSIENGETGASYNWGIAENSGACLTADYGCWTGEDCHMGFDLTSGGNLSYCHPVSATGGTLSYGAGTDAVAEGSTTVFGNSDFSTVTTYVLDNAASPEGGTCYTWGADTSYYNGFYKSCEEM